MTLGSISADFLQSTTLQELPTIQCAIINAVITETCSTMELKRLTDEIILLQGNENIS